MTWVKIETHDVHKCTALSEWSILSYLVNNSLFQAKKAERRAMADGVRQNGAEDSERVVRAVLAERHAAEQRHLDSQYAATRKVMVDDALAKLGEKYDKLREDMTARHDAELTDLKV